MAWTFKACQKRPDLSKYTQEIEIDELDMVTTSLNVVYWRSLTSRDLAIRLGCQGEPPDGSASESWILAHWAPNLAHIAPA